MLHGYFLVKPRLKPSFKQEQNSNFFKGINSFSKTCKIFVRIFDSVIFGAWNEFQKFQNVQYATCATCLKETSNKFMLIMMRKL